MKYSKIKKQANNILRIIYFSGTGSGAHKRIRERFKGDECTRSLKYLKDKELIEVGILPGTNKHYINLTNEGMDFYEKNKKDKIQMEFNSVLAFTGTIIALNYIYNFLNTEFTFSLGFKIIFFFVMLLSAIYLIYFVVKSLLNFRSDI